MATGKLPFGEPDTNARNRLWLDPVPPAVHSPAVSPYLQEIILRCLESRARARYDSSAHVSFDLHNPEQVAITARGSKRRRTGFLQHVLRFWNARREHGEERPNLSSRSPIIMVAVDTTHMDDDRQPVIRHAAAPFLSPSKESRVICVSVIPDTPVIDGPDPAETASGIHLEHLIRLRRWVEPLVLAPHRLSLHAIASPDPAHALLEFARLNHVDLIVLGAPGPTQPGRSWWQSVASTVTANAHCSVYLVRVSERRESQQTADATPCETTSGGPKTASK